MVVTHGDIMFFDATDDELSRERRMRAKQTIVCAVNAHEPTLKALKWAATVIRPGSDLHNDMLAAITLAEEPNPSSLTAPPPPLDQTRSLPQVPEAPPPSPDAIPSRSD